MRTTIVRLFAAPVAGLLLAAGISAGPVAGSATADPQNSRKMPALLQDWTDIGHANNVVGLAALPDNLYVADHDNQLWVRPRVDYEVDWTRIGHANNVVAMAGFDPYLYVVDRNNRLWYLPV